jgi:hypothetical protein
MPNGGMHNLDTILADSELIARLKSDLLDAQEVGRAFRDAYAKVAVELKAAKEEAGRIALHRDDRQDLLFAEMELTKKLKAQLTAVERERDELKAKLDRIENAPRDAYDYDRMQR